MGQNFSSTKYVWICPLPHEIAGGPGRKVFRKIGHGGRHTYAVTSSFFKWNSFLGEVVDKLPQGFRNVAGNQFKSSMCFTPISLYAFFDPVFTVDSSLLLHSVSASFTVNSILRVFYFLDRFCVFGRKDFIHRWNVFN